MNIHFSPEIQIFIPVFFFILVIIGTIATYKICKEEKKIKSFLNLYGQQNLELCFFLGKAILGLIPIKNKLAIWVLRICYLLFILFIIFILVIKFVSKK